MLQRIQDNRALTVIEGQILNNSSKQLAKVREEKNYNALPVGHLTEGDIRGMAIIAAMARDGERNSLLIKTLFDGALRVSEALGITPGDIVKTDEGYYIHVVGKGNKPGRVAVSASLVNELMAYCYKEKITPDTRIFPFNRSRAFQIVQKAMKDAGIRKPDGVGSIHCLRHSGAIERLKKSGNPQAVKDQLRHSSTSMTMRYLRTITAEESLKINEGIDFKW